MAKQTKTEATAPKPVPSRKLAIRVLDRIETTGLSSPDG